LPELDLGLALLEFEQRELLLLDAARAGERVGRLQRGALRLVALRAQRLHVGGGDRADVQERLGLVELALRDGQVALGGADAGFGLGHAVRGLAAGALQVDPGLPEGQLGVLDLARQGVGVEADQRLAGLHHLAFAHEQLDHAAAGAGGDAALARGAHRDRGAAGGAQFALGHLDHAHGTLGLGAGGRRGGRAVRAPVGAVPAPSSPGPQAATNVSASASASASVAGVAAGVRRVRTRPPRSSEAMPPLQRDQGRGLQLQGRRQQRVLGLHGAQARPAGSAGGPARRPAR
jgi:hypothetical protein